jgi:2-(1,2-epoxy-1,2-dihydrophenyl)acetyl-CoA isomerase
MNNRSLVVTRKRNILNVSFNRPAALNAINNQLAEEFLTEITIGCEDPDISMIVISGSGRSFMAGGDIRQFSEAPESITESLIEPMNKALSLIRRSEKLVVAAVQGPVAGAGMSLALATDLTIASDDARFTFAYTNLGVSGDLGITWSLPRLLGVKKALGVALLGETISAEEALRLGLVNKVIAMEKFEDEVTAIASRLSSLSQHAIKEIKPLMYQAPDTEFQLQLEAEKEAFSRCIKTPEFHQAIDAFITKK